MPEPCPLGIQIPVEIAAFGVEGDMAVAMRKPLLELLVSLLDSGTICEEMGEDCSDEVETPRSLVAEGFAKLLLQSKLLKEIQAIEAVILAKLLRLYFNDDLEISPRLQQCLSVFFNNYSVLSAENKVSPIEYGHVLLVPRVLDRLPQRIDQDSFLLALHMAAEANNPYFRLGYNSLGAFATINHLHFQAYYLAAPFPIERAPTTRVSSGMKKGGVKVYELSKFPVRGLVFEMCNNIEDLSVAVANACVYLQNENIPYNVLITDRGTRVFILPQCYAERQARGEVDQEILDTQVNPPCGKSVVTLC